MTDNPEPNSTYYNAIQEEQQKNGDLRFQQLQGGFQFGLRYLNHVAFAFKNYVFDYMLRMDDDYFFCMNQFLHELPIPMEPMFHWGWTHCIPGISRSEESMVLFSRDLLMLFLYQDAEKLKCHPSAGQMIALWRTELKMKPIFRHDSRLHHVPIVSKVPSLRTEKNLCQKYMGIHGCYSKDMLLLWENRGEALTISKVKINDKRQNLKNNSKLCNDGSEFKWNNFVPRWRFEPKLCLMDPIWKTNHHNILNGIYVGREEKARR